MQNDLEVDDLDDLGADLILLGGDGGPKKSFIHEHEDNNVKSPASVRSESRAPTGSGGSPGSRGGGSPASEGAWSSKSDGSSPATSTYASRKELPPAASFAKQQPMSEPHEAEPTPKKLPQPPAFVPKSRTNWMTPSAK